MRRRFDASPRLQRFVHWFIVLDRIPQNVSKTKIDFSCAIALRQSQALIFNLSLSYGYVTNSRIKFIIVVDASNTALRENDVRTVI